MVHHENIYTSNIQTWPVVRNIHVYTRKYLHVITIHVKRGHEFERVHGGVHGRVWRGEKEGGNASG